MTLFLFINYGVHGDETPYTRYVSLELASYIQKFLSDSVKYFLLGPFSRFSSLHHLHFSSDLTDPNRQYSTLASDPNLDLPSLIYARSLFHSYKRNLFQPSKYLDDLNRNNIDIATLSSYQSYFPDFLGFSNATSRRTAWRKLFLVRSFIYDSIPHSVNPMIIFLDVHAGIGTAGNLQVIYQTNPSIVTNHGCYLVDGLARNFKYSNSRFLVLEVGVKSSRDFFFAVLRELHNRSSAATSCIPSPDQLQTANDQNNFSRWKALVSMNIPSIIQSIINLDLLR
jgi:hypothetical protein